MKKAREGFFHFRYINIFFLIQFVTRRLFDKRITVRPRTKSGVVAYHDQRGIYEPYR